MDSGAVKYPGAPIQQGDTGDAVAAIQKVLGIVQNGTFGPYTEQVLKQFQERHGIQQTGVVGPQTWEVLFPSSLVTDEVLAAVMPHLHQDNRAQLLPLLQAAMAEFEIGTARRAAAFLAQLAHESAELRYWEELASGGAYEGRRDLGNTRPGDGRRYKGRGPIQLTGRANYRRYGQMLDLDLEGSPEIAATPAVGFRIAGLFWKTHGLNELADVGTEGAFINITRRINGGTNGLASRLHYWAAAKEALHS